MKEEGKGGSLLLPLGIGAGLLLLLTSMKKKTTEPTTAAAADTPVIPAVTAEEAAMPQITPEAAPAYSAVAKTTPDNSGQEEENDEDEQGEGEGGGSQEQEGSGEDESADDDTDYGSNTSSAKSSSGSYSPYQPSSSINTNRQVAPLPASSNTAIQTFANGKPVMAKSIRFQSDQARAAALQKARNNKSLRFQSDQAKSVMVRPGATNTNPLFVGNGKPRMGVPLPRTYRPGATNVQQQTTVASQPAITLPKATAQKQATIFPLKFGTTSPYVKEVQRKLGVSATGYFGTMTRTAIQKRFGVAEISEALYKQIITGKPAVVHAVKKPVVHKVQKKIVKAQPKKKKIIKRK